jgi:hypothetical protein
MNLATRNGIGLLLFGCCAAIAGCSGNEGEEALQLPDFLTETSESESGGSDAVPVAGESPSVMLELKLRQGDRFPLQKVVEQQLIQPSLTGESTVHDTRLELQMVISVEVIEPTRTLLGVRYNRVRFMNNIAGELTEYDSSAVGGEIPAAAAPYQRMIGNGFGFWIGPDNQIIETVGFKEFCELCIANQQELLDIEAYVGEKGVSDFVDNTIGLLPYGIARRTGESWERQSHVSRPVPLEMNTRYTLSELNDSTAVVDIYGEYLPSTTFSDAASPEGVRIIVKNGSAHGTCSIFRDTGLPKESTVVEQIQMVVQQSGAIEFPQQLVRRTTIQAFPQIAGTSQPAILGGTSAASENRLSGGVLPEGQVVR